MARPLYTRSRVLGTSLGASSAFLLLVRALSACSGTSEGKSAEAGDAPVESALPDTSTPDAGDGAVTTDGGDAGSCWTRKWTPPTPVRELNSPARELSVRLANDELTAYLTSEIRDGGAGALDLYVARRTSVADAWSTPEPLTNLNVAGSDEVHASLTADSRTLYFASSRVDNGALGMVDIWMSTRANNSLPFPAPSVVLGVSTASAAETNAFVTTQGDLYFTSDRESPDSRIYRAPKAGTAFGVPAAVANLQGGGAVALPTLSFDELTIFFGSTRTDGNAQGEFDVWTASRPTIDSAFGTPSNVMELNTASDDRPSWVSKDGCRIYLTSSRSGGAGDRDIWMATR